jgi:hypothetical protein
LITWLSLGAVVVDQVTVVVVVLAGLERQIHLLLQQVRRTQ